MLSKAHARVGRHLEAAELDQAEAAGGAVRREELVDADLGAVGVASHIHQKIAEQPVDQPGRRHLRRARGGHLRERDLQLVEPVMARFVDARRLTGRADEQAGEEIAERRMALQ